MKHLLFFVGLISSLAVQAQLTNISVEVYQIHDGVNISELAGFTTYHVYANTTDSTDFVSSVFGDSENELIFSSTGTIFNSDLGSDFGSNSNPSVFDFFPYLEFDSWITIGMMTVSDAGEVSSVGMDVPLDSFNTSGNFHIYDPIGGAWFYPGFPCGMTPIAECSNNYPAFGGDDNKVLLAQITTDDSFTGVFNVQMFVGGDQANVVYETGFGFSTDPDDVFGCNDPTADNYDSNATVDDLSCIYPCSLALVVDSLYSPTCYGDNDGALFVSSTGAQGADDYYLGVDDEMPSNIGYFNNLVAGDYYVEVVDGVGCTASETVTVPEGFCEGCTDYSACNYDPEAYIDDSSCEYISCAGCTDYSACNYDPFSTLDDGSCIYLEQYYDCLGSCFNDSDGDGVCDELETLGCTIPIACNYDPQATQDDDSCIFICNGCTDLAACNYDLSANVDDGSCEYFSCAGCTDVETCNYNSSSTIDDGSCIYPEPYYDCFGSCLNDFDADGICDEFEILGCTDYGACNYNLLATDDNDSCEYITCSGCIYEFACNYDPEATISDNESCEFGTCPGCTDSTACNYNPTVSEDDGSCEYCSCNDCLYGCTNTGACNYDSNAISDDGSCLYLDECGECGGEGIPEGNCDCDGNVLDIVGVCGGDCTDDDDGNGVCDELEIYGCTYPDAMNFDSSATIDDGSCAYTSNPCPTDLDGNGTVGTPDLLIFLGAFGTDCE